MQMKNFMVFVGGYEGAAVYAHDLNGAKALLEGISTESGVQNVYIYELVGHAEVSFQYHERANGSVQSQRANHSWSKGEEMTLIEAVTNGDNYGDIAELMDRTPAAVQTRATVLRNRGLL
jgi:hypothetical protein